MIVHEHVAKSSANIDTEAVTGESCGCVGVRLRLRASVPPMPCSLFSSLLLTFFLSFFLCLLSSFHPVFSSFHISCFLPSVPSFVSWFMFFSFPVFRSSFLCFVLCASSPSVLFFVRMKPSYEASVWDALQHLFCGKPAWYAGMFGFFLFVLPFSLSAKRLPSRLRVGMLSTCQEFVSKQDHKKKRSKPGMKHMSVPVFTFFALRTKTC